MPIAHLRFPGLLLITFAVTRSTSTKADDCDASIWFPRRWNAESGPFYEMQVRIPDWRNGAIVTINVGNETTDVDGLCWGADATSYHPGMLRVRLAALEAYPNQMGCIMKGFLDASKTKVSYIGNECFLSPPPPPQVHAACTGDLDLNKHVRFETTSMAGNEFSATIHIARWRVGAIFRLDFQGQPFQVDSASVDHAFIRTATSEWTEFELSDDPIPDRVQDQHGEFVIKGSGFVNFRASPRLSSPARLLCAQAEAAIPPPISLPVMRPPPSTKEPAAPQQGQRTPAIETTGAPQSYAPMAASPNPPPSPPGLIAMLPDVILNGTPRDGEAGWLLATAVEASEMRLRNTIDERDAALSRNAAAQRALACAAAHDCSSSRTISELEAHVQASAVELRQAAREVSLASELRASVRTVELLPPTTPLEDLAQQSVSFVAELGVDLSCCPTVQGIYARDGATPSNTHEIDGC